MAPTKYGYHATGVEPAPCTEYTGNNPIRGLSEYFKNTYLSIYLRSRIVKY